MRFKVAVGDTWNDGHGMYENVMVEASDIEKFEEAFSDLRLMENIDFQKICGDYEENRIREEDSEKICTLLGVDNLDEFGDDGHFCEYDFVELICACVNAMDHGLNARVIPDEVPVVKIGIIGYGLFSH